MNDHITKPIDPDQLFAALGRWIKPRVRAGAPSQWRWRIGCGRGCGKESGYIGDGFR